MKIFRIIIGLLFISLGLQGQVVKGTTDIIRKNELGLKYEVGGFQGQGDFLALQFKHFGRLNLGYRLFAGYGSARYYGFRTQVEDIDSSTTISKRAIMSVGMPIAGVGIEGQHPFYNHVYLFAAIEARAGYGSGYVDTSMQRTSPNTIMPPYKGSMTLTYGKDGGRGSMSYLSCATVIGIKAQLKKFTAGFELPFLLSGTKAVNGNDWETGILIHLGIFANYRF